VKRYRDSTALDGIDLTVRRGEFLTLLGPSGSGKTTTLNLIAGFTDATAGELSMDGTSLARVPPHRRNIGVVFQHYALFPHLTAGDNIAFPLKRRGVAKADVRKRVSAALELVELAHVEKRYPRELSGGQQQRVAFARAVVFEPALLLMDEPLGALDRKLRDSLQRQIKHLHRELGITFIYVTHDQDEAMVLSERIAVFNNGRIEQIGGARDLYERPATKFVATFLGESNIFEGRVADASGSRVLLCDDGTSIVFEPTAASGGDRIALMLRPEKIRLAGSDADGYLRGVVAALDYLGASERLEVAVGASRTVIVKRPSFALPSTREGDHVTLSWRGEDVVEVALEG
jgi:putative spermidine/putrescine transport system ATP-binding protein